LKKVRRAEPSAASKRQQPTSATLGLRAAALKMPCRIAFEEMVLLGLKTVEDPAAEGYSASGQIAETQAPRWSLEGRLDLARSSKGRAFASLFVMKSHCPPHSAENPEPL